MDRISSDVCGQARFITPISITPMLNNSGLKVLKISLNIITWCPTVSGLI